jgi:hypothetical protein
MPPLFSEALQRRPWASSVNMPTDLKGANLGLCVAIEMAAECFLINFPSTRAETLDFLGHVNSEDGHKEGAEVV